MRSSENLDRLLATMDIMVQHFAARELVEKMRGDVAPTNAIAIHYVLCGTVTVVRPGRPPRDCAAGAMILIPAGVESWLAPAGAATLASGFVIATLSGSFGLLDRAKVPIIEDTSDLPMMRIAWQTMVDETQSGDRALGTAALVNALMRTCILVVLRRFVQRPGISPRIVSALADPRLAGAVASILHEPGAAHTVEKLAETAGLSRSTFARQFSQLLGSSPMDFVAKTRLHYAASMLRSSRTPIKTIAASIGFSSRSHFSRSFRAIYGSDPRAYREQEAGRAVDTNLPPSSRANGN